MPSRRQLLARTLFVLLPALVYGGCTERPSDAPPVVDLVAEDHEFTAPDSVASGWVTFRMHNQGSETHYMEIDWLPEDVTFQEYRETVERLSTLVDSLLPLLSRGAIDPAEAVSKLQAAVPDSYWGGTLTDPGVDVGGVGLLGPGETTRTTLHLEPGTYVMRCGMPTSEDESHLKLGMIAPIVVTEATSGASPPQPTVRMRYDTGELTTDTAFRAGRQVVAFFVDEAIEDEDGGRVGAHLTRLDDETDVEVIVRWVKEEDFRNPAPTSFVGGADEIPEGDSAYITLDLEPGRYAWVAYPFTSNPELTLKEFTVE